MAQRMLASCIDLTSVAAIKIMTESNLVWKGFVWLTVLLSQPSIDWSQGKKSSRAGPWRKEPEQRSEEYCLRACSPWLSKLVFLSSHLLGGDTVQSRLGPPASIISQENALQIFLQANLMEALPQLGFPPPRSL